MIERDFIAQNLKEFQIKEEVLDNLGKVGHSKTKMMRTPLGEKIVISASRPGLVVGRKGANIKELTKILKTKFNLENPQIEISEVENINLDANIVAEFIASSLERFGSGRFKGVGHKVMSDVMGAGALGVEILISGKIPSSRARRWRFYQGYLKKCGDVAEEGVLKAYSAAKLKTGTVGIQVRIMPPDLVLPDNVRLNSDIIAEVDEVKEEDAGKQKNTETKVKTPKTNDQPKSDTKEDPKDDVKTVKSEPVTPEPSEKEKTETKE